jgi:cytochrome P450 family 9
MYFLTDPDLIRQITIKDFDHFSNHNGSFTAADRIFEKSLFGLNDKKWHDMRSTLSPIFTSSKMKMMYGLLSKHVQEFVDFFEAKAKKGETEKIEILHVFKRFTVDGISTAAMGFEADCVVNDNSEIFKLAMKILDDFIGPAGKLKFIFAFSFTRLYKLLKLQCMSQEVYNFFQRTVIDTMNDREKNGTSRPDVIQLLLQARKGQLKEEKEVNDKNLANFSANVEYEVGRRSKAFEDFKDEDWIAQGWLFFSAG